MMTRPLLTRLRLLALATLFLASPPFARADDFQDANRLFRDGQHDKALEKVGAILAAKPKDPQARFLKGLILTEKNERNEAIAVFSGLTQDYPELPEPYNNLAVLYASQGQYDKARAALEMAIRTHPSYATAHENLGDIYAKLATEAYSKALQLDQGNAAAQTKLALIKDLFTGSGTPQQSATRLQPSRTATGTATAPVPPAPKTPAPAAPAQTATAAKSPPAPAAPQPSRVPEAATAPAAPPAQAAAKPEPATAPKVASPAAPAKVPAAPAQATPADDHQAAVLRTVKAWAKAWSEQDVDGYLSHYAKDFDPPGKQSRKDWENLRRERVSRPKSISVEIDDPKVEFAGPDRARVTFRQDYRSDSFRSSARKILELARSGNAWLIREEEAR